ncbi:G-protein coupled receptor 143-like [Diorhabda sublineata]|uniref:G-protein coupled receptor 143-like n=1 Tax=Diorhabda sublineata TaxID=1163346 RepID=UPI0024E1628C|nr:G-protein coupled receptor 143-like [Diorhabda sublineata]
MADPTIQTFCCYHGNGTDMAVMIMEEFNTEIYNSICLFSSALGIIGAFYQILPREEFTQNHRWLSFSAKRGRNIIVWLAVADLLASVGVMTRSTVWISLRNIMPSSKDGESVIFCALSSAFTQYFYTATWVWTLCYAIDMRLILTQKESPLKLFHLASWIIPAFLTAIGLVLLYTPDANCHGRLSFGDTLLRVLPNYIATYVPIATVMMANPCLYVSSTKDMERIITSASGQFTLKERDMIKSIKIKFFVINIVFYICWIPNIINGILLWALWFHLPVKVVISFWYLMAFVNPLQAVFNCIVYRRWSSGTERVILPWRHLEARADDVKSSSSSKSSSYREELYPLLYNTPTNSVNLYKSV